MAKSARQSVFEGMELLPQALIPFVEKRLESSLGLRWQDAVRSTVQGLRINQNGDFDWDHQGLFHAMDRNWGTSFRSVLGRAERAIVNELIDVRNRLSHNAKFSYDDAERALDSMRRLMEAINSERAAEQLAKLRFSVLHTKFTDMGRTAQRKPKKAELNLASSAGLRSWRDVVEPHTDVATGTFQRAEFMADLGLVHKGGATPEYGDPVEFFGRTYLTDGLSSLLRNAHQRLAGMGGDPVVELQTNFGGGKTHSLLALYHMAGGTPLHDLPGLDQLLEGSSVDDFPANVSRAVFYCTARSPINPLERELPNGRKLKINTLWGDLAFQLGGEEAFRLVAENDRRGIAPGSNLLSKLFATCAPSLVLIDEWVAYLRQIYKTDGLPSGSFDANLTFAQSLTESVKASHQTFLVASLPSSKIEVGGDGGKEALTRLKQTFGRVEASWRPASREESYEIVRRRLFRGIEGNAEVHRKNTIKAFRDLYKNHPNDFPSDLAAQDYESKLDRAYPVHPELFDQLYAAWGSLESFQRTRGVLRLMAQVIHELWMSQDQSAMIMPGSVPASSERVMPEFRRYLSDNWSSIIEQDVDGENSVPYKIDGANPILQKRAATKRVARTIFLGTAPTEESKNSGLDFRQINLGIVQPKETPSLFGDALRRLAYQALNVHSEQGRYRYSTKHNLNRIAQRYASEIEDEILVAKIDKKLTVEVGALKDRGHFGAVHTAPGGSAEVPDENHSVRMVVLGVSYPHGRKDSVAEKAIRGILASSGRSPRVYANTLVFLASDERQIDSVKDAMRMWTAWSRIEADKNRLDLTQSQSATVVEKVRDADEVMRSRIKEAWRFLIYPVQSTPDAKLELTVCPISGQENILAVASRRLSQDEGIFVKLGSVRLDKALTANGIWRDNPHLHLKDLAEYMGRFVYLPRLPNRDVLLGAVKSAVSELVPGPFAYAQAWDAERGKYAGLIIDSSVNAGIVIDSESVIVESETAERNRPPSPDPLPPDPPRPPPPPPPEKTRFQGSVDISAELPGKAFGEVMEGIVNQLKDLESGKADIRIRVEIDAKVDDGFTENEARNLKENANTLGFIESKIS